MKARRLTVYLPMREIKAEGNDLNVQVENTSITYQCEGSIKQFVGFPFLVEWETPAQVAGAPRRDR
jgi:hypothetical protein